MGESRVITDPMGRKLTLRPAPDPLLAMDIIEAAGVDRKGQPVLHLVSNDRWMGFATLACHVSDIDGVPVPMPGNVSDIKALVAKLGDVGMRAIATALSDEPVAASVNLGISGKLSRHPALREILYLVDGGVPWDVAVKLSPTKRLAFVVARGELRGGKWNWKSLSWEQSK